MDYPKQALGFMLKQNRLDQNLSLRALAERTGISAMYLSDVENGVQRPADYTLRKLFSELALPYDPALLWQPEFTLHPLTQAILDYRMDRRDAFFDDLWRRREVLKAGCHYAQFLLAEWIVRISRGENREARVYQLRDILEAAGSALRNQDQQWYRLYRGIHHKALDEIEAAQSWLAGAEALGQDEGTQALIRYHEADCLMRLHRPQSALLIN
ncbi:MAG: helix-turn-helix domain-containing protein, partial [Holdemania filiformis]